MACPHAKTCPLFTRLGTRTALGVFKTLFCESGFARCVRYQLTTAGASVPADMLPDGRSRLPRHDLTLTA